MFIGQEAIDFFNEVNVEAYEAFFLPINVMYRNKQEFDRVYGEDINILFEAPIAIPAYIPDLKEWKNTALRFGLDEQRDLIVYFAIALLNKYGYKPPNIGDRVEIQKDLYEIRQTNLLQYGSNLQIPLSHVCQLHKVRPENPPDGVTVATPY
jgi:hypothetical protein